ncbi:MAG: hypothetical protein QOK40_2577, partial [Miltoncostaeaceae bacterium]|nr:hypothetical protein [Miltoncostaeaceae bacterium]
REPSSSRTQGAANRSAMGVGATEDNEER